MALHIGQSQIEAVFVFLPNSRRGTPRNLLIRASDFSLESLLAGEAYAYQRCLAYTAPGARLESPHALQSIVYLGATLTLDMFESEEWKDAWPFRLRPHEYEKKYFREKAHRVAAEALDPIFVVDRYGVLRLLKQGESVEPIEWTQGPPTIEIKGEDSWQI